MESRLETYCRLGSHLALLDDRKLGALLRTGRARQGWGQNRVITVDGTQVFAKSVPIAAREMARPYSTRNHYRLPCMYSYGVGSAGFGVFRELATHVRTTNWVLGGETDAFPVMYHHRILPIERPGPRRTPEALAAYVRYWNGSRAVRNFIVDREAATHQVVIFLEHVPHVLYDWLGENLDRADAFVEGIGRTVDFLNGKGVLHFDAHAANTLTDGETFFLTDFGLALDTAFELTAREQAFFDRHGLYDHGESLVSLTVPLRAITRGWTARKKAAITARYSGAGSDTVLEHIEALIESGDLELPDGYRDALIRHRPAMLWMIRFFGDLRRDRTKRGTYDDDALGALLGR